MVDERKEQKKYISKKETANWESGSPPKKIGDIDSSSI